MAAIPADIAVVNDAAERGVKDVQDYAKYDSRWRIQRANSPCVWLPQAKTSSIPQKQA